MTRNAHSHLMLLLEEPSSSKYWSVYFQYLQFELRLKLIFLRGVVLSNKMARTVILRRDYLHYIKKYNRFEKRHHNLPAHLSPAFSRTRIGDIVTVGQCKKLSKTVLFNVIRVEKKRVEGNVRKTFCMF
ncbi:MAG: 30S ribosomal protein S17 [bacterium]